MIKHTYKKRPFRERFNRYFQPKGEDECWEWTGAIGQSGYGLIGNGHGKELIYAHRAAYELAKGPIPERLQVLHKCDNRRCVNPNHLFPGTNDDNIADKMAKGRHRSGHGTQVHTAKLNENLVRLIRILGSKLPRKEICKQFNIGPIQVWKILTGRAWKHVLL
jgi:hypothetical protein